MTSILYTPEWQETLGWWLCKRIGLVPTSMLTCIGLVRDGQIIAVVGYDGFNGASCEMHVAAEAPNWLSRSFLKVVFDYPFNTCGLNMVVGKVPSGNREALRLDLHLGFKEVLVLDGAHPDGALHILVMRRDDCRWLKLRGEHGQEERQRAGT
jgi:RimJ/RimL family protein N-acetyltransferase